ncbi:hypothetical protein P3L10_022021 [Capsicum annuum]
MLPAEKLNGENNGVKQENSKSDEQDNGLINQEDMEKLELEEQTSSETEVFDLSRKHPVSDEASHQHPNQSNPTKLYWPAEILTEILSGLPVNLSCDSTNNNKDYTNHSVMWRIAQPDFNLKECPIIEETNLDYHMKNSGVSCVIEGSVNGLICLVNEAKEFFLWNPAIRKCKKLPDFRTKLKDDGQCIYGKFVNGKLYWATSIDIKSGWSITFFHLRNEKWKKVEQHYFGEEDEFLVFGMLESNLSMIYNNSTTHVDVCTMKEYENKL